MSFEKYEHWVKTSRVGRTPLDEEFLALWRAAREWKPVYESLSYGEPQPMPDDLITSALKALEAKADEAFADFPKPPSREGA
jgi:hypothetical protein